MIRAVLDANVVISALLRGEGPSGRILRHFLERNSFDLVLSGCILDEIKNALSYPRVLRHLRLTGDEVDAHIALLGLLADLVPGSVRVQAVQTDPDDDKYIGAALEGRAGFVVSGDHHLLDLREYQGVRIVSPREFLGILEAVPPAAGPSA